MQPCGNPECEYPVNGDPSISVGFCCEKCEGRFNGEEWAMGGKKKHTAYCTSKSMDWDDIVGAAMAPPAAMAWGKGAWGGQFGGGKGACGKGFEKCQHPECEYLVHSDMSVVVGYCCEKCQGLAEGAEWAEGGKRHYKHCEKRHPEDAPGGGIMMGWGAGAWGCAGPAWGTGPAWGSKSACIPAWNPTVMKDFASTAFGKGGKAAKATKGADGKGKSKGLRDFKSECKVWVGNIAEGVSFKDLQEHFKQAGDCKFAHVKQGTGTGGVAFATAEEASFAILQMNGSELGGQYLEVDAWEMPQQAEA